MAEYIDREALLQDIEQSVVFSARTGTESAEMRAARKIVDRIRMAPSLITLTPPNEPERAGLYGKYSVYKNKDGSQVTDCFVLRPDKDPAAVVALTAYATATDNAELAADIRGWIGSEPNEPLTPCDLCRYNPPSSCDGKPCCMCPAEKGSPEGEEDRK